MDHDHSHSRAVRRIQLPSGRTIEVVRFNEANGSDTRQLHVCPSCESDLVQPLSWSEAAEGLWDLTLECPNCAWTETGTYDRMQVEALEDRLDEGLSEMISDLQRLTQANMAAEVEAFAAALQANLILPEDF
ncbi:MAG TPA: hypothetical protein VME01_05105 [Solirubrobacteraceae bacterium]|nr:hypothetical protein [Solirubrobacteraceae bacterium]